MHRLFRARACRHSLEAVLLCVLPWGISLTYAQDGGEDVLDPQLNERVLNIPVSGPPPAELQVTFFRPNGPGPFPLAVLNHGKEHGRPREEKRYRSAYAARYFLSRGYAVVLPMMRGFAGSGGETWIKGCDAESEGIKQARDVSQVIAYMAAQSDLGTKIDPNRVVVFGQSLGGWNTLAFGTLNVPGVKGLANFAGVRNAPMCASWQKDLAIAAGHYGAQTQVPSIWFYGDNDSRSPAPTWREMHQRYSAAGGQVELVAYGRFMRDSHNFLGQIEALPIWIPRMDAFLARIGLPSQNLHPELLPAPYPAPTHFAAIDAIAALPLVDDNGRKSYEAFLQKPMPRVFAIAADGSTFSTDGGYDPLARVQAMCKERNRRCQIYAVDDQVVWPKALPVPPATQFAKLEEVAAVPYLNQAGRQSYRRFLTLPRPRAFVVAPDGAWAFSARDFDVQKSALQSCAQKHQGCRVYAIDDQVVWPEAADKAAVR